MIKALLKKCFDAATLPLCRLRGVSAAIQKLAYQRKRVHRRAIERRLRASGKYGDEVQRGPFAGLRYLPPEQYASCRFEKIIGAYEHEIHGLITDLAATGRYATIVNVGAAEGFYTVGLARLFPNAKIISYESTEAGREYCAKLAELNGVAARAEIRGECTLAEFHTLAPPGPVLVWMDIDLGERVILDPEAVPWLGEADILVELHECLQAGTNALVVGRFEKTHRIRQFASAGLAYADYPPLRGLTFAEIYDMVCEDRPGPQDWCFMERGL
jgi:hypothetical protein